MKEEKNTALCVLFAIILSCAFEYIKPLNTIPDGFTIIICAVVASVIFAIAAPIKEEEDAVNG